MLALAVSLGISASAAQLAITNASFEIPAGLANGAQNSGTGYSVPGWIEYEPANDASGYAWEWDIYNPTAAEMPGEAHGGTNVMMSLAYNPATSYVEQVLTNSLENGKQYTLSGWVADPDGHTPQNGARFFLYAGTHLLGVVTNTPVGADTWSQASLVYDAGTANLYAGQPLKVRIMHNPGNSYRVLVDDLTLVSTSSLPLPTPTNLTARLFGVSAVDLDWISGGGAVGGYRIERALGAGAFVFIAGVPASTLNLRDSFLPASTVCTYRITATNVESSSASVTVAATTAAAVVNAIPGQTFANVADFGFMWWSNGQASATYAIKTSRYAMEFNRISLSPVALFPLANAGTESAVLTESAATSFPAAPPVSVSCLVITNGTSTNTVSATAKSGDVQLVECGKFFQRRYQKVSVGSLLVDTNQTGLEVAAWPDRISFVLRVVPKVAVANGVIEMKFGLTNTFNTLLSSGAGGALQAADGSGFAFLKSTGSSTIAIDPTNSVVTVRTTISNWATNQEKSVGLVIYPAAADTATVLDQAVATETTPLALGVSRIVPASGGALSATYDADRGWHNITLPSSGTAGDNGILRVRVAVTNNTASARVVRLNFNGVPFYIPGLTAVLRDNDLNPIGIPVQLSKNWHKKTPAERFEGEWFHGLTMLTVPANTNLRFELTMAGQNWGGLPAATHSQLSVIGYDDNGNQQWDEAALGNFGESLCYDAEHSLTDNDGTDSRPILLLNSSGQTGQWCGNFGGAQFLRCYDTGNSQRRHSRMRTQYSRYCPNLAEAVYAGQIDDGAMDFSYSAALYRSDDYTRGVHRLQVTVNSNLSFGRLVFFQQAADTYAYNNGTALAYGNATNLAPLRQWTATFGQNENIGTPVALTGPMPWAMTLDSPADPGYSPANRGFVIRSWRSCLNGSSNVPPYLVERSIPGASLFDLVPPPGVTNLRAGDYLEAEIVRFYVPKYASNYYGPNDSFRRALTNYQNTYQMGLREAVGNNLTVTPQWGMLERLFPIQIQATNNRAGFTVTGGLGCVPVTFTGLSDYRAPVLEENVGGVWAPLNQAVAGSDFWQCDYNAARGAWEITFTLKLDGTNYLDINSLMTAPPARTFRFRMGGAQPPRFSTITPAPSGNMMLLAEGEPGSSFALLSSDSLAVPLSNWAVATNGSTTGNPFTVVVPTASNAPQRFYALRTQ